MAIHQERVGSEINWTFALTLSRLQVSFMKNQIKVTMQKAISKAPEKTDRTYLPNPVGLAIFPETRFRKDQSKINF